MNDRNVAIIGMGHMGFSLLSGLLKSGVPTNRSIEVYDVHTSKLEKFRGDQRVRILAELNDLNAEIVILCTKPQDLPSLGKNLAPELDRIGNVLLISILAGVKIEQLQKHTGHYGATIRAMPNIAAKVSEAATALAPSARVTEADRADTEKIFGACGDSCWVQEKHMDAVTGLSGSGPAYIFMVIEALTDGGVSVGLPRDVAQKLATQTVLGAATLVKSTGEHPALLKDQVTTPAGTTISACVQLEAEGLRSMFVKAVQAATERSESLGRQDN